MKRLFNQFATLCVVLCLHSCGNEEVEAFQEDSSTPKEVEFTIDYSFSSGSMTRSTNDDIYTKFFNDYIKTKKITPKHYFLSFIDATTKQKTEVSGTWTEKGLVRLLEGNYTVSGSSINKSNYKYVRDSLVLSFNDNISINSKTTSINLKAGYSCSLVFFDTSITSKVRYYSPSYYEAIDENLKELNGYFYGFVQSFPSSENTYFEITRKNEKTIKIYSNNLNLENGKYYFFNDVTGGFDLVPMTPGN